MSQALAKDLLVIAATGMVGVGLWWLNPSYALIGVGLLILLGLAHGSRKK